MDGNVRQAAVCHSGKQARKYPAIAAFGDVGLISVVHPCLRRGIALPCVTGKVLHDNTRLICRIESKQAQANIDEIVELPFEDSSCSGSNDGLPDEKIIVSICFY